MPLSKDFASGTEIVLKIVVDIFAPIDYSLNIEAPNAPAPKMPAACYTPHLPKRDKDFITGMGSLRIARLASF